MTIAGKRCSLLLPRLVARSGNPATPGAGRPVGELAQPYHGAYFNHHDWLRELINRPAVTA
ncbi:hypothetical protein [Catellatospora paridis]|uniref:hypothetical protein n=1 Tax=Catellatospora paridis TaxID=1617086 RepID=UPI0012D4A94B|nr:hypothetical protein [Catellatospora paridis]